MVGLPNVLQEALLKLQRNDVAAVLHLQKNIGGVCGCIWHLVDTRFSGGVKFLCAYNIPNIET